METKERSRRNWMSILVILLAAVVAAEGVFLYGLHQRLENRGTRQVAAWGAPEAAMTGPQASSQQRTQAPGGQDATLAAAAEPEYWPVQDALADLWLLQHVANEVMPFSQHVLYVPSRSVPAAWTRASANAALAEPRIQDTPDTYVITMNLPGLDRSDIQTRIDGDTLTVSGTQKKVVEKKQGSQVVSSEQITRRFEDSLMLPAPVKPDQMRVSYDHNVLTIRVPKA